MAMVSQISPKLRHLVDTLVNDGKFGICSSIVRVNDVKSGCVSLTKQPCGDHFKVMIPFAGHTLLWEVLFDSNYLDDPPDFIFPPEDADFCPNVEDIKSLGEWEPLNPRALLQVLEELLYHYKLYQQKLIEMYSRMKFELTSLLQNTDLEMDDIEIYSNKVDSKIGSINFLIRLPVDFLQIPAFLTKDNPGEDTAVLLITFSSPDSSRVSPQLYLSPRVEHAFGGASNLRIPSFPSGCTMMDYVPSVCQLLQNKVDQTVQMMKKKKEYIASFLGYFGRSVLEYDADSFSHISFLFEWNDFFFIFHIDVPPFFPQEQPVFTFQSIYHECKGKPYTEVHDEYPYSPRWSGIEMADRARNYILENIGAFQKQSVISGSL